MKITNQFLAGSALCLLMAAPVPAEAAGFGSPMAGVPSRGASDHVGPMLAQLEAPAEPEQAPPGGGECPSGTIAAPGGGCVPAENEAPPEQAPPEEAPPEAMPEQPAEEPPVEEAPPEIVPEPAPPEAAPPEIVPAPAPPEAAPAPAPEEPAGAEEPADTQAEEPPAPEDVLPPAEPEAPAVEEAPAEEAVPEPAPERPAEAAPEAEQPGDMQADEPPAAEDEVAPPEPEAGAPAAEDPVDDREQAPAAEEAPAGTDGAEGEAAPAEDAEGVPPADIQEPADADEQAPAEPDGEAAEQEEPAQDQDCPPGRVFSGEDGGCVVIDQDVPLDEQPGDQAAPTEEQVPGEADVEAGEEGPLPENAAPVLDSQKEGATDAEAPDERSPEEAEVPPQEAGEPEGEVSEEAAEEVPVPESDAQAQEDLVDPEQFRTEIRSIIEEEGERIELGQTPEDLRVRRAELYQRREDARVIEEYNDNRRIVEINNNIYVESPDYDRIVRRDDEVYYEQLRDGRVREVIERRNGTRVITVRNRYGDVIRRVRVTPDGQEYVLSYVPEERFDEVLYFEDPARDLPPLRLTIPVSEYIMEADTVEDPDRYYTFLHQPPVEPVRRLYSIDEVKYSARVRDMVRRIDLDTIEFEFGSARIEESEIVDLEAVANAILRMLDENPAETFLIEGHTDAVGSETANLALSDRRAEAVARGLTDVFDVPPENLVTQGYGEQYLKIQTEEPERENRRVAVRRITPLVSPVASRQ